MGPPVEAYNPTAPRLSLPALLDKIEKSRQTKAIRDNTEVYEHNPFLLDHLFASAPYTVEKYCSRCTRSRKCRIHREPYQGKTDVRLCPHVRLNLYWAINDPDNRRSSWKLEVRDYTHGDPVFVREHRGCMVFRPSDRVGLLAERVVEDYQRMSMGREGRLERDGGLERRVREELGALLGAWDFAKVEEEKKKLEEERLAREMREKAQEQAKKKLAKTLRKVQEMRAKEEKMVRKPSVEGDGIVQSVEDVQPPVGTVTASSTTAQTSSGSISGSVSPSLQSTSSPPTPLPISRRANSPEPKSEPELEQSDLGRLSQSATPKAATLPESPLPKRKFSDSTPSVPSRASKRVHFSAEVEASPIIQKARLRSLDTPPPVPSDRGEAEDDEGISDREESENSEVDDAIADVVGGAINEAIERATGIDSGSTDVLNGGLVGVVAGLGKMEDDVDYGDEDLA